MRYQTQLLALSFAFSIALAQPAFAESVRFCDGYADNAVSSLVKQAVEACGFTGPAWQASRQDHFNWCRGASFDAANSERANRDKAANECVECTRYAKDATKQQKKNDDLQCHFTGDLWSDNSANHKSWCSWRKASAENLGEYLAPDNHHSTRDRMLKQCEAKAETCKHYAQAASNAALMNSRFGCGLTGARFDGAADHYGWCMANDAKAKVFETNARENAIQMCKAQYKQAYIIGCQNYATTAVSQYKRMAALGGGCQPSGPRWHGSWDGHFSWCIQNFKPPNDAHNAVLAMNAEQKARDAESRQCTGVVRRDQRFPMTPSLSATSKAGSSKSTSSGKSSSSSNSAARSIPSSQRTSTSVRTNPSSRALTPGLLESNSNLAKPTPSATGTPIGGAGGSSGGSGGGGSGAATLR